ncbi:M23 family metallopeptidase [Longirhabdus pacifica]|uniref:M23 family metallopeptidase n=1 Tax=Longirhabdus pacifica TaxID=2305227 RepID=UPI001008AA6F|nr:M23 family metallopeptidase [Longirhabdus pacifica]
MKRKRSKGTFTFMLVPNADKEVRQVSIHSLLLYSMFVILVIFICIMVIWQIQQKKDMNAQIVQLNQDVKSQTEQYFNTVEMKNEEIEQLQNKINFLSNQTTEIEQEIEEIKALKRQLEQSPTSGIELQSYKDTATPNLMDIVTYEGEIIQSDPIESILLSAQQMEAISDEVKAQLKEQIEKVESAPSIWPTSTKSITSNFGMRSDPFTGAYVMHNGIDIDGVTNDPIYATAKGTITAVGNDNSRGKYVIITHNEDIKTVYMHLNEAVVEQGSTVTKGQMIGKMGSTGRSTGSHLHYEIQIHNKAVNPLLYLP